MYRSAMRDVRPTSATTASNHMPSPKGVVTIEVFGDFQCPPCAELHADLKTLRTEYGDRLRPIFSHLPLGIHEHALTAAHGAVAAGLQGKFWEMHDLLYQNQPVWSESADLRPIISNYARQLGLDLPRFMTDLDSPKVRDLVSADIQRATAQGIDATPTVFIAGQMIDYENTSLEQMRAKIDQGLKR
jgi:protein-disulfide isomerase